jgi:hypothetical protein
MASTNLRATPGPGGLFNSTPRRGSAQETYRKTSTIPATSSVDSGFAGWAPSGFASWAPSGKVGSDYGACRDVIEASGDNPTVPHHHYPKIIHSETGALGGRTTAKAATETEHQCPQPPTSHSSRSPGSPGGA